MARNKDIENIGVDSSVRPSDPLPEHLLYDEKGMQADLGNVIADVVQCLYRSIKRRIAASQRRQAGRSRSFRLVVKR